MKRSFTNLFMIIMILASLVASGLNATPAVALASLQAVPSMTNLLPYLNGELNDVWGADATHVFAVGAGMNSIGSDPRPLAYHTTDGTNWNVTSPISSTTILPAGWTAGSLSAVWGFNATDVYAVGDGFDTIENKPMVSHWNGSSWTSIGVDLPGTPGQFAFGYLDGVSGYNGNVYAVGRTGTSSTTVPMISSCLSCATSGTWSSTNFTGWTYARLEDVWASSSNKIYVVGWAREGSDPTVPLLYTSTDGSVWTRTTLSLPTGWSEGTLLSIWGSTSGGVDDIYIAGSGTKGDNLDLPLLYHSTGGSTWDVSALPLPAGWTTTTLQAVSGSSTGGLYAAGFGTYSGNLRPIMYRHTDTGSWVAASFFMPNEWSNTQYNAVWNSGASNVYIGGYGFLGAGKKLPLLAHASGTDTSAPNPVTLTATPGGTAGTVNLSWPAAADDGSDFNSGPVDHYKVIYSQADFTTCNDGTEVPNPPAPAPPGMTQTMTISNLDPGALYYFSVCAWDDEGKPVDGAFAATVTATATVPTGLGPGMYDDVTGWTYMGSWAQQRATGPYQGGFTYTSGTNDTATFTFNGVRFTLYYTQYTNRGEMYVYIDNFTTPVTTINANGALVWQQSWTSNPLTAGVHTVMVKYKSGSLIDIDAIQIFGPAPAGMYDDRDAGWAYTGSWGQVSATGPYQKTFSYTSALDGAAMFTFIGNKVTLYYTQYTNRGQMYVYIDNFITPVTTINANGALVWQKSWTSDPLTAGVHTVMVKYKSGTMIDVDAIRVSGPVYPGLYDDRNSNWVYTGSWTQLNTTGPYQGTYTYSQAANDTAAFTFLGDRLTLYYTQYTNRGQMYVYIDNFTTPVTTINANGALVWQQSWTSDPLTTGEHTVLVKHATGTYIDVDAILISGPMPAGMYDDRHPGWTYTGGWAQQNATGPYQGTFSYTSSTSDAATFTFTGTGFTLYYTQYTNRGEMYVYIDNFTTPVATINANGALTWQKTWASGSVAPGVHTLMVKYKSGSMIDIDAVQIQ